MIHCHGIRSFISISIITALCSQYCQADLCCNTLSFANDWCKQTNCLGYGCNMTKCPSLNGCICAGRIKYRSKSFCAIVQACSAAAATYRRAKTKVLELTGLSIDSIPDCTSRILNVICAYEFPRCDSDEVDYPDICWSTCNDMANTCVSPSITCTLVNLNLKL